MANYVEVNPKMLRWVIDRSGLSTDDFKQPVEEWLNEESQPTFSKLEAFAKKAMVPFGYLFLSEPPTETLPIPDYRTRSDDGVNRPSDHYGFDFCPGSDYLETVLSDAAAWG